MTLDEAMVLLCTKTGLSRSEWDDFFALSPAQQELVAKTYVDQQWVQSRGTWSDVLSVIGVIATLAGAVSGVGSAYAVIRAL